MIKLAMHRGRGVLLLLWLALSLSLGLFMATQRAAAAPSDVPMLLSNDTLYKQVSTHQHYWWLYSCYVNTDIDGADKNEVTSWDFFEGNSFKSTLGAMYGGEGTADCQTESVMQTAYNYLGATDSIGTFCALDGAQYKGKHEPVDVCKAGPSTTSTSDNDWDNDATKAERAASFKSQFSARDPGISNAGKYLRAYMSLTQACNISFSDKKIYDTKAQADAAGAAGEASKYPVPVVYEKTPGNYVVGYMVGIGTPNVRDIRLVADSTVQVATRTGVSGGYQSLGSCDDAATEAGKYAQDYATYLKVNGVDSSTDANSGGTESGSTEPVCSAGALGWVFCPLTEFMSKTVNGVATYLEGQLKYEPLLNSDQGNAIKAIWQIVLNMANVGLIIAFLFIVFSQATSIGLSTYGIKKMLPKIIIAAILMNLSFYLCAIAVDIANIAGVSIKAIIDAGLNQIGDITAVNIQAGASGGQWAATVAALLLAVGVGFATGAIFLVLPILATGLVSVLTAWFIIVARQIIITLLIVVSPLAMLAWVLPNTEDWFSKWRKIFASMLLMFPLIMIVFYGSTLMSHLILVTANGGADDNAGLMVNLIAFTMLTVPLFSLPFIMKAAGGILERFGGMVNNRNKGIVDRARKMGQEGRERTRSKAASDYDPTREGFGKLKNARARLANKPFLGVGADSRARARFGITQRGDQYSGEQMKLATSQLSQRGIMGNKSELYNIAKSSANNPYLRRAAAAQLGEIGATDKLEDLFRGEVDLSSPTGERVGQDKATKRIAAQAIGAAAPKLAGPAAPLFFDAVTYEGSMKADEKNEPAAIAAGEKVGKDKIAAQMGPSYLAGLRPDQVIGARKAISKMTGAQQTATIASTEAAIRTIGGDARILNTLSDEHIVEIGKMAKSLGIAASGMSPELRERYERAAAAVTATSGPFKPGETPPPTSTPSAPGAPGSGWD